MPERPLSPQLPLRAVTIIFHNREEYVKLLKVREVAGRKTNHLSLVVSLQSK